MTTWKITATAVSIGALLTACGGDGATSTIPQIDSTPTTQDELSETATAIQSASATLASAPSAGRLLASQCAQCHGTDGNSSNEIEGLAGESSGEIIEEMLEMKQENENDIMHKQAMGYSDAEIRIIAEYFASLPNTGGHEDD